MPLSSTNERILRSSGGLPSSSLQMNTIVSAYGPVGDERLRAVEQVLVAVAAGGRLHRAERVGARVGLGDRPRADLLHREQLGHPALLLARSCRGLVIAAAVSPIETPIAVTMPGAVPAQLDDRDHRERRSPCHLLASASRAPSRPWPRRPRRDFSASIRFLNRRGPWRPCRRSRTGCGGCRRAADRRARAPSWGTISFSMNCRTASRSMSCSSVHSNTVPPRDSGPRPGAPQRRPRYEHLRDPASYGVRAPENGCSDGRSGSACLGRAPAPESLTKARTIPTMIRGACGRC